MAQRLGLTGGHEGSEALGGSILDGADAVQQDPAARIVKIFELAFPLKVTPLSSSALRLVFRPTITHTQRQYRRQRLRGEVMDWKTLLIV